MHLNSPIVLAPGVFLHRDSQAWQRTEQHQHCTTHQQLQWRRSAAGATGAAAAAGASNPKPESAASSARLRWTGAVSWSLCAQQPTRKSISWQANWHRHPRGTHGGSVPAFTACGGPSSAPPSTCQLPAAGGSRCRKACLHHPAFRACSCAARAPRVQCGATRKK